MVVVYVDDVMAFSDATNVSFWASSLVAHAVTPTIERVDLPPVIPSTGAPAVRTTYERWRDKEDTLLSGGLTWILEAAIFDAADFLVAELRLCYLCSSLV